MKTLPTFWPVMTVLIALAEVGLMVATVVTSGLAPIRFTPDPVTGLVVGFDNVTDSGYREVVPNFFIGTSKGDLVHNGAMYTPVSEMRCIMLLPCVYAWEIFQLYCTVVIFWGSVYEGECEVSSGSG